MPNREMDVVVVAMRALRAARAAVISTGRPVGDEVGARAAFDAAVADLLAANRPELLAHVGALLTVVALSENGDRAREDFVGDYIEHALFNASADDLSANG